MRTRFGRLLLSSLSLPSILAGCASGHLNSNTVEISATISDVYTSETLNNINKSIDNKYSFPSQITLNGGTIQTTDTIQPNITFPLAPMTSLAAAVAPTGITRTNTGTTAGPGASVQGSFTQQQNYTVAPLNDAITLRNQRAIYQYAVWGTSLNGEFTPPRILFENTFFLDPFYLQYPQCVLCDTTLKFSRVQTTRSLKVNPKLRRKWVLWDVPPSPELIDLGHYGDHEILMRRSDYVAGVLNDFVLFTLPFSVPAEVIAAPSARTPVVLNTPNPARNPFLDPSGKNFLFSPPTPSAPVIVLPQTTGQPATNQQFSPPDRQSTFTPQGILPPPQRHRKVTMLSTLGRRW